MKKKVRVSAAVIKDKGKVLLAKRAQSDSMPGKWEFPGGKIEPWETPEECIIREIKEELDIDVKVESFFTNVVYEYEEFILDMDIFFCTYTSGDFRLTVHEEVSRLNIDELEKYNLLGADRIVARKLLDM